MLSSLMTRSPMRVLSNISTRSANTVLSLRSTRSSPKALTPIAAHTKTTVLSSGVVRSSI